MVRRGTVETITAGLIRGPVESQRPAMLIGYRPCAA
jgi:hypothetical protein